MQRRLRGVTLRGGIARLLFPRQRLRPMALAREHALERIRLLQDDVKLGGDHVEPHPARVHHGHLAAQPLGRWPREARAGVVEAAASREVEEW